jgi:hypothetical protein
MALMTFQQLVLELTPFLVDIVPHFLPYRPLIPIRK